MIRIAAQSEAGMTGSFLPFSHCQGPQENAMTDSGIPGWLTSLNPRENLVLHWKTATLDTQRSHRVAWQCQPPASLPSSPPLLAFLAALLSAQPPCPAPRTRPHVQICPGNCCRAAGVQKAQAGHPWRRNTLAGFKKTSPAPGSTVVINSIKIPSGAVQQG